MIKIYFKNYFLFNFRILILFIIFNYDFTSKNNGNSNNFNEFGVVFEIIELIK